MDGVDDGFGGVPENVFEQPTVTSTAQDDADGAEYLAALYLQLGDHRDRVAKRQARKNRNDRRRIVAREKVRVEQLLTRELVLSSLLFSSLSPFLFCPLHPALCSVVTPSLLLTLSYFLFSHRPLLLSLFSSPP